MPRCSRGRRADGFSLVEVVVALALLTIGVFGALQLFGQSTATNATARAITQTTIFATDKIEQLRSRSIDDPLLDHSPPEALTSTVEGYADQPADQYVRRWSVEPLPSNPVDGVVIRVVVTRIGSGASAFLETVKVRKPSGVAHHESPG